MEVMSDETISNSDSHNHAGQFIRRFKGSNPSRSTFSSSVILTLLLFFCMCVGASLALGPRGIRTARPCRRQGKQPAQCNGDDRSQWLKQGGAVGAAWDFSKPCKGLGKIHPDATRRCCSMRGSQPVGNIYRGDFRFCRIVLYDAAFFMSKKTWLACIQPGECNMRTGWGGGSA